MSSVLDVQSNESLPFLSSQDRLNAYNLLTSGCSHIWSKNQLQTDKALKVLNDLIPLTQTDPYFLSHLTSYVMTKSQSKDLQVFLTYASSLSSADGTPFSVGSTYLKPNLRYVAAAATQMLDPKLVERVMEIASMKYTVPNYLNLGRHFPISLRTALEKYLTVFEYNLPRTRKLKEAGMGNFLKNLYRGLHKHPTNEVAAILHWQQKANKVVFEDSTYADFKNLDDLQIAEKVQKDKLPLLGVLGALPRAMSPVIAVALLEQATGNQAVILRKTFEDAGVLNDPEVMKLFEQKIRTAKTALDRAETLSQTASEAVKQSLIQARSEVRKDQMTGIGKIYLHLDFSGSMNQILMFAVEKGAIIAECVNNPHDNFRWGLFGSFGEELPLPDSFVKDAFAAKLFGKTTMGSTDCLALYGYARGFGADIDVFVTDQGHNVGPIVERVNQFHAVNPGLLKPKVCVIVDFGGDGLNGTLAKGYQELGVPVAILKPEALSESALVVDAVKNAMLGPVAIVDEIMNTELLKLPKEYFTL